MHILLAAVAGGLAGPLIHHIAVQAGGDRSFAPTAAACRRCGASTGMLRACPECGLGIGRPVGTAVATSVLSGLAAWSLGPGWIVVAYGLLAAMTVALFLTDVDHKRIPNRISYPGTILAAVVLTLTAALDGRLDAVPRGLLGGLVYAAAFGAVYVAARGGFGFGDVKLAVSLGIFTAFLGWRHLFVAGMATAAAGGIIALGAVVFTKAGARTEIPYGPAMIIGSWVAIVGGSGLAEAVA